MHGNSSLGHLWIITATGPVVLGQMEGAPVFPDFMDIAQLVDMISSSISGPVVSD